MGFPAAVRQTSGLQSDRFSADFNSGLFECHLWSSKPASAKISVPASFISLALGTVVPPLVRSSTYIFFMSSTISGCLGFQVSKCCSMTPAPVNRSVSTSLVGMFFNQWNLWASLSSGRILTWKNTFLLCPVMVTGLKRPQINTLRSWFCSGRPVLRHSLRDGAPSQALAEASYTILSLVLSVVSRRTPLCGI